MMSLRLSAQSVDFIRSKKEGCAPMGSVNFTDASTGGTVVQRKWDLGNGTIVTSGDSIVGANYLDPGTYTIKLTATFANGVVGSVSKQVVVHPHPTADFVTADTAGCAPLKAQFKDLSTAAKGKLTAWQWDFGSGTGTEQNPDFTFNQSGSYNVALRVENSWGCWSKWKEKTGYINVDEAPETAFTASNSSSCKVPFTVKFTNTTTGHGDISYQWDFGDGAFSTEENPSHTYTSTGTYTVRLTASVEDKCSSTAMREIEVGGETVGINAPDATCMMQKVSFEGYTTPSSNSIQYSWHFSDDGTVKSGKKVNHTFHTPGDFTVKLITTTSFGCVDTSEKIIHVNPKPTVKFDYDQQVGCSVPFSVDFTSHVTPANDWAYSWDFGDGDSSSEANPTHIYRSPGPFTVKLTVRDTTVANSCGTSITKKNLVRLSVPKVDFSLNYKKGCIPFPVKATPGIPDFDPASDTLLLIWGDGNTDTVTHQLPVTHTYTETGTFDATLVLLTAGNCRVEAKSKSVEVVAHCEDDGSPYNDVGDKVTHGGIGNFTVGKVCENKYKVTLTDTVNNKKVLSWDFGDGTVKNTGTLNPVTHTFPSSKEEYTVTVKRKDLTTGKISTNTKDVILIDEKASFQPDLSAFCRESKAGFHTKGIDSSKIKTYIWNFGDGSPLVKINNIRHYKKKKEWLNGDTSHIYKKNGVYDVQLIIEDRLGCRDTFEYPVSTIVKGPLVGFTATHLASCDSIQQVTFTDTSRQDGTTPMTKWEWDFGDGNQSQFTDEHATVKHTYKNSSFYNARTVKLTVTDADGCAITVKKPHLVKGYQPKADFTSTDTVVCSQSEVTLKNTSLAKNAAYLWNFGDGSTSTQKKGVHQYDAVGSYDITLKVTDEAGCVDSVVKKNFIQSIEPVADFSIGGQSDCAPVSMEIHNNSQFGKSREWDFGDGSSTTDKDPLSHVYSKPGYYTIRLIVKGVGNCADTMEKTFRVRGPIATIETEHQAGCRPFEWNAKVTGKFISSYAWDFGDGTPVHADTEDSIITHKYENAGKYTPNLIMESPGGCTFKQKMEQPVLVDSVDADFVIRENIQCDSTQVIFSNFSKTPEFSSITEYQWDFGDGNTSAMATPATHTFGSGDYRISLITKSKYGCIDSAIRKIHVKAYAPPVVDFTAPSEGCVKEDLTFSAEIQSPDSIDQYHWSVNGAAVGEGKELTYSFDHSGSFDVTLTAETIYGCSDTKNRTITIRALPAVNVSPDTVICSGNKVSLSAEGGQSYQWTPATGLQGAHTAHPTAAPQNSTRYVVEVTDQYGCTQLDSVLVGVDERVDLQVDSLQTVCKGSSIPLKASGNTSQFMWSPADGLDKTTGPSVVATPTQSTVYHIKGVSQNSCPDETAQTSLELLDVPDVHLVHDTDIVAGTKVKIPVSTTGNIIGYNWTPTKGLSCTHCAQPSFIADHDITYKVTVTMDNGCKATDEMMVHTLCNGGKVYVPTAFTPNGDGNNDVFYIHGYGITVKHFAIFNRWGKKVFEKDNIAANDASQGWHGRVNNQSVTSTMTFVYKAEIECVGGDTFPIKGYVVLIR